MAYFKKAHERMALGLMGLAMGSEGLLASSSEAGPINWWGLGSAYADAPALGWLLITFALFVAGLIWAIRKPLSLYLEARSKDIQKSIEEGRMAKKEAEEKLKEYENRLKKLNEDVDEIKRDYEEKGQALKREIEHEALQMKARILQDAEESIKASLKQAKNRLAEEMVTEAFSLAQKKLKANLNHTLQSEFCDQVLNDLKESDRVAS